MHVEMASTRALLGIPQVTREAAGTVNGQAALLGVDAGLGVPGLPQSATGQTTILTGHNAAALLGEHYGPYPSPPLRNLLSHDALFKMLLDANYPVAYANAYPNRFLDRLRRGKGRLSANTYAAFAAGLKLRDQTDLQQGQAIAALLSNDFWPEPQLKLPPLTAYQAGQQLATLAQDYSLTFFEYWYSDMVGHKMEREQALIVLQMLDDFLMGILDEVDLRRTLLLVVSDHGNFEDWTTRKHTPNPALAILAGPNVARFAPRLQALTDIKPVVLSYLFD